MKRLNLEAICQRRTDNTMPKIKRKTPHRKLKIEQYEPPERQDEHGAPDRYTFPTPLMEPVMLLL